MGEPIFCRVGVGSSFYYEITNNTEYTNYELNALVIRRALSPHDEIRAKRANNFSKIRRKGQGNYPSLCWPLSSSLGYEISIYGRQILPMLDCRTFFVSA